MTLQFRKLDGKLHFHDLARMSRSAKHYDYWMRFEKQQTDQMKFGSLVHAILLGGQYLVYEGERRGHAWRDFKLAHPDERLIVTESEVRQGEAVAAGILDNIAEIDGGLELLRGAKEVQVDWTYRGRPARSRIDILGSYRVVDLKTTTDASPARFNYHARKLFYHAQMSFYRQAVAVPEAYLIAAEIEPPFATTIHRLKPRALDIGERLCLLWFEQLRTCEESGKWPSYTQTIVDFDVPEVDEELELADAG